MSSKILDYSVFVSGLSNSVMRDGYVKGISESTSGHVENISLGASNCGMGLWMLNVFAQKMRTSDVVILDYFIMDYQTDDLYVNRDLPILLRKISRFSTPVVLLWPDKINLQTPAHDKIALYSNICAAEACLFIDCRELVTSAMSRHGLSSLDALFQDIAHIYPHFAYEMGVDIAKRIDRYLSFLDQRDDTYVQVVACEDATQAGPPWLKVPVTSLSEFVPESDGELIGMMILTKHADFEIRAGGASRRVWTYWAPEDPNPPQVLRYVSIASVPLRKGQSVRVETYAQGERVDGMAVHSLLIKR